jgi:hypothetical protein
MGELSDRDKIDRAAFHEEVRFYKRQQWAVTTAGVVLLGALLAIRDVQHMAVVAVVLIPVGLGAACFFLDDLQEALGRVRRMLDPFGHKPATRGSDIMILHKLILVVSALVVLWAILFKPHPGACAINTGESVLKEFVNDWTKSQSQP